MKAKSPASGLDAGLFAQKNVIQKMVTISGIDQQAEENPLKRGDNFIRTSHLFCQCNYREKSSLTMIASSQSSQSLTLTSLSTWSGKYVPSLCRTSITIVCASSSTIQ